MSLFWTKKAFKKDIHGTNVFKNKLTFKNLLKYFNMAWPSSERSIFVSYEFILDQNDI